MRFKILALAVLALLAGAAGHAASPAPAEAAGARPNILLIVVDTLRADYLSSYGYHKITTPNLDRLMAGRGLKFAHAFSVVPLTGPSHAVMFASRYPQENGAIRNGVPIARDLPVLAQVLREQGYATAAFVSGWTLQPRMAGLDRGFDVYDAEMPARYRAVNSMRPGEQTTAPALAWLRRHVREKPEQPFFLFVHYFDPHAPYEEHRDFAALENNPAAGTQWKDYPWRDDMDARDALRYAGEIAYADRQAGILLNELQKLEIDSRTLAVFTADHGESLGEHGYKGHGRKVYQTNLWVPLIVRFDSRVPSGVTVTDTVSLMDLAPTLLDFAGVRPPKEFRGQSLKSFMAAGAGSRPARTGEVVRFQTYSGAVGQVPRVLRWLMRQKPSTVPLGLGQLEYPYKVIYTPALDRMEVYDLSRDPYETRNLAREITRYREYGDRMVRWVETTARAVEEPPPLSREDEQRLRSLGYLQ